VTTTLDRVQGAAVLPGLAFRGYYRAAWLYEKPTPGEAYPTRSHYLAFGLPFGPLDLAPLGRLIGTFNAQDWLGVRAGFLLLCDFLVSRTGGGGDWTFVLDFRERTTLTWKQTLFAGEPAEENGRRVHFPKVRPAAFGALLGVADVPPAAAGA
jgi:hypothetical protein